MLVLQHKYKLDLPERQHRTERPDCCLQYTVTVLVLKLYHTTRKILQ